MPDVICDACKVVREPFLEALNHKCGHLVHLCRDCHKEVAVQAERDGMLVVGVPVVERVTELAIAHARRMHDCGAVGIRSCSEHTCLKHEECIAATTECGCDGCKTAMAEYLQDGLAELLAKEEPRAPAVSQEDWQRVLAKPFVVTHVVGAPTYSVDMAAEQRLAARPLPMLAALPPAPSVPSMISAEDWKHIIAATPYLAGRVEGDGMVTVYPAVAAAIAAPFTPAQSHEITPLLGGGVPSVDDVPPFRPAGVAAYYPPAAALLGSMPTQQAELVPPQPPITGSNLADVVLEGCTRLWGPERGKVVAQAALDAACAAAVAEPVQELPRSPTVPEVAHRHAARTGLLRVVGRDASDPGVVHVSAGDQPTTDELAAVRERSLALLETVAKNIREGRQHYFLGIAWGRGKGGDVSTFYSDQESTALSLGMVEILRESLLEDFFGGDE